jgi:hypothetical protein
MKRRFCCHWKGVERLTIIIKMISPGEGMDRSDILDMSISSVYSLDYHHFFVGP